MSIGGAFCADVVEAAVFRNRQDPVIASEKIDVRAAAPGFKRQRFARFSGGSVCQNTDRIDFFGRRAGRDENASSGKRVSGKFAADGVDDPVV